MEDSEEESEEEMTSYSALDQENQSVLQDTEREVSDITDQLATGDIELDVPLVVEEGEEVWDKEERLLACFMANGCNCNHGPHGTPCHRLFTETQLREMRDECRELTSEELDLVIMGELRALTLKREHTWRATERVRTVSKFQFGGQPVCIKTFCFLHAVSRWKFNAIKSSWLQNGLRPRQRKKSSPHNVTRLSDIRLLMRFLLQYAEDHAILLPGRVPGYKRDDIQLLPSSTTKREVWEIYSSAISAQEGTHTVCYSLFCRLWRQLAPQIVVTKPMSDLCWVCQKNSNLIMRSHNRPVEEKTEVIM